jgi:4-oxalocrotonate tautomerase family enzyme
MPVVIVEMWEGRASEQKETLIKGITRAFEQIGTKPLVLVSVDSVQRDV